MVDFFKETHPFGLFGKTKGEGASVATDTASAAAATTTTITRTTATTITTITTTTTTSTITTATTTTITTTTTTTTITTSNKDHFWSYGLKHFNLHLFDLNIYQSLIFRINVHRNGFIFLSGNRD